MEKYKFRLDWWNGDEYDHSSIFETNATKECVLAIVKEVQKMENYNTDDVIILLEKRGYNVKAIMFDRVDF